jgi:hypothetical protein
MSLRARISLDGFGGMRTPATGKEKQSIPTKSSCGNLSKVQPDDPIR